MEKESFLAEFEDIEKNDFNLNIPRYVDNFEKEEEIDLKALLTDMKQNDAEISRVQGEFVSLLKDLTSFSHFIKRGQTNGLILLGW